MNTKPFERELQILNVAIDCIDSVINRASFSLVGKGDEAQAMFFSRIHQQYFYINVLDFLSDTSKAVVGDKYTLLQHLEKIGKSYVFHNSNSPKTLKDECLKFAAWLEAKVVLKNINASSINQSFNMQVTRLEILKICGNMSKHNLSRLDRMAKLVSRVCRRNNIILSLQESIIFMPQLYEQLHDDILNYHASTVAELLNNIRWAIHDHLLPEFRQSYRKTSGILYTYKIPSAVSTPNGENLYWELMNHVRSGPIIERFTASQYLKGRY